MVDSDQPAELKFFIFVARSGIGAEMVAEVEPTVPLTSDSCAVKAEDCRQDAQHEANAQHRVMLEHMAKNWDRIALSIRGNAETRK